jgi:methionyl-tRNA formyltransferase
MTQQSILIVTEKQWNIDNAFKFQCEHDVWIITNRDNLTLDKVEKINPRYIFLPHWSWKIPKQIWSNYITICFHMTDLPFGRGKEPLQHLILMGKTNTKISAFRVSDDIDTGPIYMKRPLILSGNAEDIYKRCSDIVFEMIKEIILKEPLPTPQVGEPVELGEWNHDTMGKIPTDKKLSDVYDCIRAWDATSYSPSFIVIDTTRLEFTHAQLKDNQIIASIKITKKDQ